jgi:hypothetical protein
MSLTAPAHCEGAFMDQVRCQGDKDKGGATAVVCQVGAVHAPSQQPPDAEEKEELGSRLSLLSHFIMTCLARIFIWLMTPESTTAAKLVGSQLKVIAAANENRI